MMYRCLDLFITVAEEKNLSRAAERLHLSQSALTRQIQAQEEELGVRLFDRTGRGVELTHAGAAWLRHAQQIRESLENATEEVRRIEKGRVGRIEIGVFGSSMFGIVPEILNQFSQANPEVEMVMHNVPRTQQLEALRQGRNMVSFMPFYMGETDLEFELICNEPLMVAMHEGHPLAGHAVIDFDELRDFPVIGPPSSHAMPPRFRALLDHYGFEFRVAQRSDNVVSSLGLVRCSFGITFVPASVQSVQIEKVVYRPLQAVEDLFWDLHCVYRKNETSLVLHALLQSMRTWRAAHLMPGTSFLP